MDWELHKLRAQLAVLKDVEKVYPTSSIPNAITQIEARIKHIESRNLSFASSGLASQSSGAD
jgi:hypothetical protein